MRWSHARLVEPPPRLHAPLRAPTPPVRVRAARTRARPERRGRARDVRAVGYRAGAHWQGPRVHGEDVTDSGQRAAVMRRAESWLEHGT